MIMDSCVTVKKKPLKTQSCSYTVWPESVCIPISQGATLQGADFLTLPIPKTLWEAMVASARGWRQGMLGSLKRAGSPVSLLTLRWQ